MIGRLAGQGRLIRGMASLAPTTLRVDKSLPKRSGVQCNASLKGQVHLVTGSTDGIGRHTAKTLAEEGATVLVHGRTQSRVSDTVKEIVEKTGNENVTGYTYDLASMKQIHQFADAVRADHESIDVLLNNAGVFENNKSVSEDGYEMTWAVNVLAPYLLTSLLLDKIKARIVNTSSLSACSSIDFDNLQQERGYSEHGAYALSKLCSQLFTFKLASMVQNVTVNCLDPGTVNTKMLLAYWGSIGVEVEDANGEYFLITSPSVTSTTGKYFVCERESRAPLVAYDKGIQDKLWAVMREHTGAEYVFPQHVQ